MGIERPGEMRRSEVLRCLYYKTIGVCRASIRDSQVVSLVLRLQVNLGLLCLLWFCGELTSGHI